MQSTSEDHSSDGGGETNTAASRVGPKRWPAIVWWIAGAASSSVWLFLVSCVTVFGIGEDGAAPLSFFEMFRPLVGKFMAATVIVGLVVGKLVDAEKVSSKLRFAIVATLLWVIVGPFVMFGMAILLYTPSKG